MEMPFQVKDLRTNKKSFRNREPQINGNQISTYVPGTLQDQFLYHDIENADKFSEYYLFKSFEDLEEQILLKHDIMQLDFLLTTNTKGEIKGVKPYKIAKYILEKFCLVITPITKADVKNPTMYIYNNGKGVWEHNARQRLETILQHFLKDFAKTSVRDEIIEHIRVLTACEVSFNRDPYLIPCNNCILDIHSFPVEPISVLDYHPTMFITTKLATDFEPQAQIQGILKFLNDVLDSEYIITIQEMIGDIIFRDYRFQKFFILYGQGGNGKGTLIDILTNFIGEGNYAANDLYAVVKDIYARASLHGKFANVSGDIAGGVITKKYVSILKHLSGGEPLTARHIYQGLFDFVNFALIIASTNHEITFEDQSYAFDRRFMPIGFNRIFKDGDPDKDSALKEKLTTPEELSGLLIWGLQGLARLLTNHGYTMTETIKNMKTHYDRISASSRSFIRECVAYDPNKENDEKYWIPYDKLNEYYLSYCKIYDVKIQPKQELTSNMRLILGQEIKQKGIGDWVIRKGERRRKRVRVWTGIEVKLPLTEEQDEEQESSSESTPLKKLEKHLETKKQALEEFPVPEVEGKTWKDLICEAYFSLEKDTATIQQLKLTSMGLLMDDWVNLVLKGIKEGLLTCLNPKAEFLKRKYRIMV